MTLTQAGTLAISQEGWASFVGVEEVQLLNDVHLFQYPIMLCKK